MPERVILCGKCHVPAHIVGNKFEAAERATCPRCGREDKGAALNDALSNYLAYQLDWQLEHPGIEGPVIGVDQTLYDGFRWIFNRPL